MRSGKRRESFCTPSVVSHTTMLIGVILVMFFACMIIFAVKK
jgi:hypothetical protein